MSELNVSERNLKRVRSPNYPSMSLVEAVQQIEKLSGKMGKHAAPPEALATSMGYSGVHGASGVAISALGKYGLLERVGEDYKLSELAMKIIAPHDLGEKVHALQEASQRPSLFAAMVDAFQGDVPSDDILRPYLIRKGFAHQVVGAVIAAYRETMELVDRENARYLEGAKEAGPSTEGASSPRSDSLGGFFNRTPASPSAPLPNLGVKLMEGERELTTGLLSKTASFRLIVRGEVGQKEIERLIAKLKLDKEILADEPTVEEPKTQALGVGDDNAE